VLVGVWALDDVELNHGVFNDAEVREHRLHRCDLTLEPKVDVEGDLPGHLANPNNIALHVVEDQRTEAIRLIEEHRIANLVNSFTPDVGEARVARLKEAVNIIDPV